MNSQFSSPVIKDGVLDATAKAKSDATFAETKTGNEKLDSLLNEGGCARTFTTSCDTGTSDRNRWYRYLMQPQPQLKQQRLRPQLSMLLQVVQERQVQAIQGTVFQDGVPLQRNLSRVPYNQAAINDVNNPAWVFGDGSLKKY